MRLTSSSLCLVLAVTASFAVAATTPAHAQRVNPAVKRKLSRIDLLLRQVRVDPGWEKGTVPASDTNRARRDMQRLLGNLNRATREFNTIPAGDRPADVQARLDRYARYHKTVMAVLDGSAAAPGAAPLSPRTQRAVQELQRQLATLVLDPTLCAGNIAGRVDDAGRLAGSIATRLSFAESKLAAIPAAEHSDPRVAPWAARIAASKACAAAIRTAKAKQANDVRDVGKRRRAFLGAGAVYRNDMQVMVGMLANPNLKRRYTSLASVQKMKSSIEAVHTMCTGEYKYVLTDPPSTYSVADEERPIKWCEAAAKRHALLKQFVINSAPQRITDAVANLTQLTSKIAGDKAWMSGEAITKPFGKERYLAQHADEVAGMYKLVGMAPPADATAPLQAAYKAYWSEMTRVAATQRRPRGKGHNGYAEGLARKRITRDGGVSIKAVGLLRDGGQWKIQRNALRQPISRTLGGFVFYRLGSESLCRVGIFAYKELAAGRGFKKPPGVQFTRMQFVPCR